MKKLLTVFIFIALLICLSTTVFAEESIETAESVSAFDKSFQVSSVVILTFGILGLPLYFWLNSRKKRLLREYYEKNESNGSFDSEDSADD